MFPKIINAKELNINLDALKDKGILEDNLEEDSLSLTAIFLLTPRVKDFKWKTKAVAYDVKDEDPSVYSMYFIRNEHSLNDDKIENSLGIKHFKLFPVHEKYIEKLTGCRLRIVSDLDSNTVYVCIKSETVEQKTLHLLSSFYVNFYKIFKEKPLEKDELEYLKSLTFKTASAFSSLASTMRFKESVVNLFRKIEIAEFEKKMFDVRIGKEKLQVAVYESEMKSLLDKYREMSEKLFDAKVAVEGLEAMKNNLPEHTDLQDYLETNNNLKRLTLNDYTIEYIVKTYFVPHHLDEWETITRNNNYFNRFVTPKYDRDQVKLLLNGFMSENRTLKLKICGAFKLECIAASVSASNLSLYKADEVSDCIPNPHLYYNSCLGTNKPMILEQLTAGETIGAIECTIASTQRVNIHENTNFNRFIESILTSDKECFETEDGKSLTPDEALKYLEENHE